MVVAAVKGAHVSQSGKKKMSFFKQVALILRIRWPFSERKLRVTIVKKNFDSDYIISHRLLSCMEAKK